MRYAVVKANGTHEVVSHEGRLGLQAMQRLVAAPKEEGATIEAIGYPGVTIYMNENGKYLPLDTNTAVSRFAHAKGMISRFDFVKGDCVIVGSPDETGYDTDMDDEILKEILSFGK